MSCENNSGDFTDKFLDTAECVDTWLENIEMPESNDDEATHACRICILIDFLLVHNGWHSPAADSAIDQLHASIKSQIARNNEELAA